MNKSINKKNKIHKSQISPETMKIIEENKSKRNSKSNGNNGKSKKRNSMKRRRRLIIFLVVVLIVLLLGNITLGKLKAGTFLENNFLVEPETKLDYQQMDSQYVYVYNLDEKKMTAGKNENKKMYPASLTKMMTAIVTIEKAGTRSELLKTVEIPQYIIAEMNKANAAVAGFAQGEQVTYLDLLYGLMLPSGGDACLAIADTLFGSESAIVSAMNDKAAALNLKNTHFVNPIGLHDQDHYSTAEDMEKILEYGLKNPIFKEIITSEEYVTSKTPFHPQGILLKSTVFGKIETTKKIEEEYGTLLENTNRTLSENHKYIKGGKSGYTEEAQLCLATFGQIDNKNYIVITAKAKGDTHGEPFNMYDTLYAYGQIHKAHVEQKTYINEKLWRRMYFKLFAPEK